MSRESPHLAPLPSDRRFGITLAAVFAALGVWGLLRHGLQPAALSLLAVAPMLALVAAASPAWLRPLNRAWRRIGLLLGKVTSPLVLGLLYFLVLTPTAWLGRLTGRDPLRLRPGPLGSNWIDRHPPGPDPDSFKNLF